MAMQVRRLLLCERASQALGGAAKLGDLWGVTRRAVQYKLAADRGVSDAEISIAANAVEARAEELARLAADMREMIRRVD